MNQTKELQLYLAVSECRTRIMRGFPADEAAALSVLGRDTGLLAEEVKRHAVTAVHACAGARRRRTAAESGDTLEPLSSTLSGDLALCGAGAQG